VGTNSQGTLPRSPHLPYMVLRDEGPQPQWVGSPDQGAESRAQLAHPLVQLVEINTNRVVTDSVSVPRARAAIAAVEAAAGERGGQDEGRDHAHEPRRAVAEACHPNND
jgi:hypothetical protein